MEHEVLLQEGGNETNESSDASSANSRAAGSSVGVSGGGRGLARRG